MPTKTLPERPSLTQLKLQAKELQTLHARRRLPAAARIIANHPRLRHESAASVLDAPLKLADAQLVIAREYGFESWARLKHHVHPARQVRRRGRGDRSGRPREARQSAHRASGARTGANESRAAIRLFHRRDAAASRGVEPESQATSPGEHRGHRSAAPRSRRGGRRHHVRQERRHDDGAARHEQDGE